MNLKAFKFVLLLLFPLVLAAGEPKIVEQTPFPGKPDALYYFDDSEVILTIDQSDHILYTSRNGGKDWKKVSGVKDGDAFRLYLHPKDNKMAVMTGFNHDHWITFDQGESWRTFSVPAPPDSFDAISFHYDDPKKIMYHTSHYIFSSIGETFFTTDAFESISVLHNRRRLCTWSKSTKEYAGEDKSADAARSLCIVEGERTSFEQDFKLLVSDDYFQTTHEPKIFNERTVAGMVSLATVKNFIVVAAKAINSIELVLYVTKDTSTWHRAIFGQHRIEEDSYTILESTNYSIQVQVTPDSNADIGVLYSSNSNGTYFTKLQDHVNRDAYGIMDFEKVQNIQGVFMINVVDNGDEYAASPFKVDKKLVTKITFDDGRTFQSPKSDGNDLHLHSVTDLLNTGRVFSSPAPGILMGNGNTGAHLTSLDDANLYISDDAGENWIKTPLEGPHKYEIGDQGAILLAVAASSTDKVSYSLDHGKNWKSIDLGSEVSVYELTTVPDSTSLKFTLSARDSEGKWNIFSLDFSELHERKCGNDDFEDWYARKDADGNPMCLMGHKQHFRRRKADSECKVDIEFKESLPISEPCTCTDNDFECDYNFRREDGKCVLIGRIQDSEEKCKDAKPEDTFMGSSGWRLIPGNDCKRSSGKQKDELVKHKCSEAQGTPASGDIAFTPNEFKGNSFDSTYYLERDPKVPGDDETVLALIDQRVWKSHDHGKTWALAIEEKDDIIAIYPHSFNNDYVYFITASKAVYYSKDRAKNIHRFEAPDIPNFKGLPILSFHQKRPDWIIWTGNQNCVGNDARYCHVTAHVSTKNGAEDSWTTLQDYVKRCKFVYRENKEAEEKLVFCEHWKGENTKGELQLLSSEDFFATRNEIFPDVADFATMAEFIVVASKTEDKQYLKAFASVDGKNFAHAEFPKNFPLEHETAYTVLDSDTNAIFLHVTENDEKDREYGPIMKSNSNGTSYVISMRNVNRDERGYVDWEKVQGIEGVAIVNVVGNVNDVKRAIKKKLKTMITHDDGATWSYLACPVEDLEGGSFNCDANDYSKKSLHIHGYTKRKDPRDTFSSPSAVGLMIGVGNVGEYLGLYNEGSTFLTKDGGVSWTQIQKDPYIWEFGDQGSIIVLVSRGSATNTLLYSTDEGAKFQEIKFSDDVMTVERISTVPSDNSRNFLLWGTKNGRLTTVNVDFTGLTNTQCYLPDKEEIESPKSDYVLWWPRHPLKKEEPDCLFGHKKQYYRKKPDSSCYNGPLIDRLHKLERNCSCTREDFECDFNFERAADGSCAIAPGLSALPADHVCTENKDLVEYFDVTGYRKIPLSTCTGGRELQYAGQPKACPNHEEEFEKKHGISGVVIFFAIILPIALAAGAGYYVFSKWDGKFGRIRLGDVSSGDRSPLITWSVAAISGIVAVVAALPLLVGTLWNTISSRFGRGYSTRTYRSRDSFARGGLGDYAAVVDADEGVLLGDDSDEEAS